VAKVEQGAGLLLIGSVPADLKDRVPLEPIPAAAPQSWTVPADTASNALRALPFRALPEVREMPGKLRAAATDALEDKAEPLAFSGKGIVAAASRIGKGRVVQLTTSGPILPRGFTRDQAPRFDYWEYHLAMLGRLLYLAAGKESPVALTAIDCAPKEVVIRLQSQFAGPANAHVRLRDKFGAVLDERDLKADLKAGQAAVIAFAPPRGSPMPAG